MRKQTFGVLSTVSPKGYSQSTGVLYGISQTDDLCVYIYTGSQYKKVQNIRKNSNVSFVIPFPHHIFQFVPANTIAFQAIATILPNDDSEAHNAFETHRILRMMIEDEAREDTVFLRLQPRKKLHVYGVGYSVMELKKDHEDGNYTVNIPLERQLH